MTNLVWVLAGLNFLLAIPTVAGQVNARSRLKVTVLEGDGAINNIREGRAKEPVVEVRHENNRPVARAAVSFLLPDQGPGGTFPGGEKSLTVLTGENGLALARGLRPNKTVGQFQIRVTASYQGQSASAAVTQTNAEPADAPRLGSSKKFRGIAIVVGTAAAGALVAGILAGSRGKTSTVSSPPAASPGTVLIPGSPTFGPPQ